jgi:hypothetical protein
MSKKIKKPIKPRKLKIKLKKPNYEKKSINKKLTSSVSIL